MNELDHSELDDKQFDYIDYDYQELMKKYPILFIQKDKSMQETCMCWGIECGIGWYVPINELCSKLEELNHDYKKYRVQIQAQQVKEKFGGLRFYFNVYFEKSFIEKLLIFPFKSCEKFLGSHFDFATKIEKTPESKEEQWEEISEQEFEEKIHPNIKNDFGWKFVEKNEKFYRNKCVYTPMKIKFYATKHKLLYKIKEFCMNVRFSNMFSASEKRQNKANLLYDIANELIRSCEEKCWDTCEKCGEENNFDKSNIITTSGWISRICKKCSQKIMENETKIFDEHHPNDKYNGIDRITLFKYGYNSLDLHNGKSFQYDGKYYCSIPHAYFSKKIPSLIPLFQYMVESNNNKTSKIIEKIAAEFDFTYDPNDYNLIKDIVSAKFSYEYNKDLKEDLLNTKDKLLVYMNGDCQNVLGECYCDNCKQEKGQNLYGKILMEVRKELKNKKSE